MATCPVEHRRFHMALPTRVTDDLIAYYDMLKQKIHYRVYFLAARYFNIESTPDKLT